MTPAPTARSANDATACAAPANARSGYFATSKADWDFAAKDIQLADALGGVLSLASTAIEARERMERERDQALAVLDLAGTPFAVSDPLATELRLNDAARRLLADVVDADGRSSGCWTHSTANGGFARRIEVELVTGETSVLHAHLSPLDDGARPRRTGA